MSEVIRCLECDQELHLPERLPVIFTCTQCGTLMDLSQLGGAEGSGLAPGAAARPPPVAGAPWRHARRRPAREDDLELARQVHYGFLPRGFSDETLDIAVAVLPHEDIGGDYCSIFPVNDERVVVSLCDAVGHGLASALFATRVNTYVLTHARESRHPCELIENLNEFLCEHLSFSGMYATVFSVFFNTQERTMTFAGAGHPPALHYEHASGDVSLLRSETHMVGLSHPLTVVCSTNRRVFAPGDKILLYTDGLSERRAADGSLRGVEDAVAFLAAHGDLDSAAFNERLLAQVTRDAARGLEDDVLFMTVTVKQPPASA